MNQIDTDQFKINMHVVKIPSLIKKINKKRKRLDFEKTRLHLKQSITEIPNHDIPNHDIPWHYVPTDLWKEIINYLEVDDYIRFVSTCKRFSEFKQSKAIKWNGLFCLSRMLKSVFDENRNVIMHGPGGTGKSFSLFRLYREALRRDKRIAMTSTTGVSAILLPNGRTLHAFSGLGQGKWKLKDMKRYYYKHGKKSFGRYSNLKDVDILVIDEVSMMGRRMFEKLNWLAQIIREDHRPMGGIQMVFCGDFLQLPPVLDSFVFTSVEWSSLDLKPVIYDIPFRQAHDKAYASMLRRIRYGEYTERDVFKLKQKIKPFDDEEILKEIRENNGTNMKFVAPQLFSTKAEVQKVNDFYFNSLQGDIARTSNARDELKIKTIDENKNVVFSSVGMDSIEIPESKMKHIDSASHPVVYLKEGVQYILTSNIRTKSGLVNGSSCICCEDDFGNLELRFENGVSLWPDEVVVTKKFPVKDNFYLFREQYALRPGYAATIHSSQGSTFDRAVVRLGKTVFMSSQAYVALSRVKTFENLHVTDFDEKSLKTHHTALNYVKMIENQ